MAIAIVLLIAAASAALSRDAPVRGAGEEVPVGEAESIAAIVATIEAIVNAAAATGQRPVTRDAHAKGHGCVRADFDVAPDLSPALRVGVFAQPRRYSAWIRFSNGNGAPHDDHDGDGRGMAIKLLGVEGPKLLSDEANATTQDFVMINYPTFFVRNAADYVVFTKLSQTNQAGEFFRTRPHEAAISAAIAAKRVDSVFEQRYFSMTPYRLGTQTIKFSAIPVVCRSGARIEPSQDPPPVGDPDYLRDGMASWLNTRDACFRFAVQLREDPKAMPVEDPTIVWDETESPFLTVASIRIPKQVFNTADQQEFCENLSFTPWHSLAEHRPIGGMNRLRQAVYQEVSILRHKLNGAARTEPNDKDAIP
jgi:hypothetical protein